MSNYYDMYKRDDKSKQFYRSTQWKKMRAYIFKRDMGLCQWCAAKGKVVAGNVVHHKVELLDCEKGWELRLSPSNLITVCHACHNNFHKGNNDDVVREGLMFNELGELVKLDD